MIAAFLFARASGEDELDLRDPSESTTVMVLRHQTLSSRDVGFFEKIRDFVPTPILRHLLWAILKRPLFFVGRL